MPPVVPVSSRFRRATTAASSGNTTSACTRCSRRLPRETALPRRLPRELLYHGEGHGGKTDDTVSRFWDVLCLWRRSLELVKTVRSVRLRADLTGSTGPAKAGHYVQ